MGRSKTSNKQKTSNECRMRDEGVVGGNKRTFVDMLKRRERQCFKDAYMFGGRKETKYLNVIS